VNLAPSGGAAGSVAAPHCFENKGEGMTKKVSVSSTSAVRFVEAVIELSKLGAVLPKNEPVFKGVVIRTVLEIGKDVEIPTNPVTREIPNETGSSSPKKDEKKEEPKKAQKQEEGKPVVAKKAAKKASAKKAAKKASAPVENKQEEDKDSPSSGKEE